MQDGFDDRELELIRRAQGGDANAFCALLQWHDLALRRLAYRVLGSRDLMDDVLQNAYIKGFAAIARFEPRTSHSLRAWLHRIVYTTAVDELRRRSEPTSATDDIGVSGTRPAASEDQTLLRLAVLAALRGLPTHQRALLVLVDEAGFGYDEAAQILEIPRGTVASGLNRARSTLRQQLSDWEAQSG